MESKIYVQTPGKESLDISFAKDASQFAFNVSQLFEKILLNRGLEATQNSGACVVLVDTIRDCIDESLVNDVIKKLNESEEQCGQKAA